MDAQGCIKSPGYGGNGGTQRYQNRQECTFDVNDDDYAMEVLDFNVEGSNYDYLKVNGQKYSGSITPHEKVPKGEILWSSDFSVTDFGWKICPKQVLPPPAGEKYTMTGCLCKQGWSYQGVHVSGHCGNPDNDPNGDWCKVESRSCEGTWWGYCKRA